MKKKNIKLGTHGENYGSWMSWPFMTMFVIFGTAAAILAVLSFTVIQSAVLGIVSVVVFVILLIFILWMFWVRRQYSFTGGGVMPKVHQVIADNLDWDGHGKLLEVGCGSGALSIRCALTWPEAEVTGVDYWGAVYAYSRELCEKNAASEGAGRQCTFVHGDARHLDFPDESFDAVVSNYVYHNIAGADRQQLLLETLRVLKKGGSFALHDIMSRNRYGDMDAFVQKLRDMGYEDVRLISTTEEAFGSSVRANMVMLADSTLLVGRK